MALLSQDRQCQSQHKTSRFRNANLARPTCSAGRLKVQEEIVPIAVSKLTELAWYLKLKERSSDSETKN